MENKWSEREAIIQSLSQKERRILFDYEKEHGRLFPGAIYKVIQDQKDLAKEKHNRKKRRK